jgi:hypothetical protein
VWNVAQQIGIKPFESAFASENPTTPPVLWEVSEEAERPIDGGIAFWWEPVGDHQDGLHVAGSLARLQNATPRREGSFRQRSIT